MSSGETSSNIFLKFFSCAIFIVKCTGMKCPDCGQSVPVKKSLSKQSDTSAECTNCGTEFERQQNRNLLK